MSDTRLFLEKTSNGEEIPIMGSISVGRSEESLLRLTEGKASRHHAQLTADDTAVFVEDLGSTNGTFVNDRRLDPRVRTRLTSGDRLRFDTEEFVFRAEIPIAANDLDKTQFRPAAEPSTAQSPAAPAAWFDKTSHTVFVAPRARKAGDASVAIPDAADAPGGAPYILIGSGERAGSKVRLFDLEDAPRVWRIGSQADREIRLSEAGVSAVHATLKHEGDTWLLADDLSVSGTFVNDKRTMKSYLRDGDRIQFGPVECVFRIPPPAPHIATAGSRLSQVSIALAVAFVVTLAAIFIAFRVLK